jgi:disulfide bond formation protein DsbB
MFSSVTALVSDASRLALIGSAVVSATALAVSIGSEWWLGFVPCALCWVERACYGVTLALGIFGAAAPSRLVRVLLDLTLIAFMANAAVSLTHYGVERNWWASPVRYCAPFHYAGGSIAQWLKNMPDDPHHICEHPTYLVPGVPLSMAGVNLLIILAVCSVLAGVAAWSAPAPAGSH